MTVTDPRADQETERDGQVAGPGQGIGAGEEGFHPAGGRSRHSGKRASL